MSTCLRPLPGMCSRGYQVELRDVHGPGGKSWEEGWPWSSRVITPFCTMETSKTSPSTCTRRKAWREVSFTHADAGDWGFLSLRPWEEEEGGVGWGPKHILEQGGHIFTF